MSAGKEPCPWQWHEGRVFPPALLAHKPRNQFGTLRLQLTGPKADCSASVSGAPAVTV